MADEAAAATSARGRASSPSTCRRTPAAGIVLAGLSTVCGFALIWHIWWLVVVSFVAATIVARHRPYLQLQARLLHSGRRRRPRPKPRAPDCSRTHGLNRRCPSRTAPRAPRRHAPLDSRLPVLRHGRAPRRERHAAGVLGLPDERLPHLRVPVRRATACWAAATRAAPPGAELFDLPLVALNTSLLLLSSITYGFAMLEMQKQPHGAAR